LCIEPWGENAFRVRATEAASFSDHLSALIEQPDADISIDLDGDYAVLTNGKLTCILSESGKLRFLNQNGDVLLEEYERTREMNKAHTDPDEFNSALEIIPRTFQPHLGTDNYKLTVRFEPNEHEKLIGMGQYQQPYLDIKGCVIELAQRNSQTSIPFVLSSYGYGFLWNNPAIGSATFGKNITEWAAQSTKQMDYWITAGDTPAEIEEAYADVTGKAPMMPEYGMGFWQCKLRYQTQEELLEVAREYKRRGVPISVIVIDYFHWPFQGDWKLDPDYWPDPQAMIDELKGMGIELMVSVWPTVEEGSENYQEMVALGYLTRSEAGKRLGQLGNASLLDATNADARKYAWQKLKNNYYDMGIKIFWLDEAEPEFTGYEYSHYRYAIGADLEVGNIYPKLYAKMVYDGMTQEGQENILNLLRCAWAGSQRYGALVWSGDIDSSFRALRNQLCAGLNIGLAGIPWWTTDIGGFHGGNIHSDAFKECFVRWFQFGAFSPVMRLHGYREPFKEPLGTTGGGKTNSGAENEIWSYGEDVYEICKKYIELREKMRPYIREIMAQAHEKGTPVIRPLFYDFPENSVVWAIDDEYMFGPDILVCPILYADMRERSIYLPEGAWIDINDGTSYQGKQSYEYKAPIENIPAFVKAEKYEKIFG
jgi:alpha-D-xyloside xylohydrolase